MRTFVSGTYDGMSDHIAVLNFRPRYPLYVQVFPRRLRDPPWVLTPAARALEDNGDQLFRKALSKAASNLAP